MNPMQANRKEHFCLDAVDKGGILSSLYFLRRDKLHLSTYESEGTVICEALLELQEKKKH